MQKKDIINFSNLCNFIKEYPFPHVILIKSFFYVNSISKIDSVIIYNSWYTLRIDHLAQLRSFSFYLHYNVTLSISQIHNQYSLLFAYRKPISNTALRFLVQYFGVGPLINVVNIGCGVVDIKIQIKFKYLYHSELSRWVLEEWSYNSWIQSQRKCQFHAYI